MIGAMGYLLEAENCMTAAQAAVDPDEHAAYLRQSAFYRNLALEVMQTPPGKPPAFSLPGADDPCAFGSWNGSQRRAG